MKPSYLQRRAAALEPAQTSRPTNSRDWLAQGEARLKAQLLVDSLDRTRRVEAAKLEQLPAERLSAADMLTTEELLELDAINRRELHVADQTKRMYQTLGDWLASNPSFPASEQALALLMDWGHARGLNCAAWGNADLAWQDLQRTGTLRPDYSEANVQQHKVHLEQLRKAGFDVRARDLMNMPREELDALVARGPLPRLEDSLLIDTIPMGPEPDAPVPVPADDTSEIW